MGNVARKVSAAIIAAMVACMMVLTVSAQPAFADSPTSPSQAPAESAVTGSTAVSVTVTSDTYTMNFGIKYAGKSIEIFIYSTPQLVGSYTADANGSVAIPNADIAALGLAGGQHKMAGSYNGDIIGYNNIVLNADGSVNVAATQAALVSAGVKDTGSDAGVNPLIPVGAAVVVVAGVAVFVLARRESKKN